MIHAIYIYLIIGSFLAGFFLNENSYDDHPIVKILCSILWIPFLIYLCLRDAIKWVWGRDFMFALFVHLGYNHLRKTKNKKWALDALTEQFVPKWEKQRFSKFYISALDKLKKMNEPKNN